jgi:rhodanese-related sulfurtransferase
MNKFLFAITASLLLNISGFAYDADQAKKFEAFYSHFTQKACADSKLFITAEETFKMIRDNEAHLLLDIRTEGEAAVIALSGKDALHIPLQQLFEKENLDKLPINRPILIVCHSGTRAVMAAMSLKVAGITNTRVVKGGLAAMAVENNPKNAPLR